MHDCSTPCVEIQSLLPDGGGGKNMGPEWAVERDAHILGAHGGFRALVRGRPVTAGCVIECERGM